MLYFKVLIVGGGECAIGERETDRSRKISSRPLVSPKPWQAAASAGRWLVIKAPLLLCKSLKALFSSPPKHRKSVWGRQGRCLGKETQEDKGGFHWHKDIALLIRIPWKWTGPICKKKLTLGKGVDLDSESEKDRQPLWTEGLSFRNRLLLMRKGCPVCTVYL